MDNEIVYFPREIKKTFLRNLKIKAVKGLLYIKFRRIWNVTVHYMILPSSLARASPFLNTSEFKKLHQMTHATKLDRKSAAPRQPHAPFLRVTHLTSAFLFVVILS